MEFIKRTVSFIFSGLVIAVGLIIATPIFILSVLLNWVKLGIGFTIFWVLASAFYDSFILNKPFGGGFNPINESVMWWLVGLSLIGSIYVTVAQVRE